MIKFAGKIKTKQLKNYDRSSNQGRREHRKSLEEI